MANVQFAVIIAKWVPFLGYHHFLMIFIAITIILLCECLPSGDWKL